MTYTESKAVLALIEQGMPDDEALATVLAARPVLAPRRGKLRHASVCEEALAAARAQGWEPRLPPEDYEAIAATAGCYAKTLPLVFVIVDVLEAMHPLGVRGLLYQLLSAGWIPSTADKYYQQVDRLTVKLREREVIPFEYIVDELRVRLKPSSWSDLRDYGETVRDGYRKNFWEHLPVYVEVFVEKQAMAAVLQVVTDDYDVALNPIRGMSSLSALHRVGMLWREIDKPICAYYLGDHDPSGLQIELVAREKLAQYSVREVAWERLGVLPEDFETFDLLRLAPKKKDPNLRRFYARGFHDCAELDAIPAPALRDRLRAAIERHIPADEWARLQQVEALEKQTVERVFRRLGKAS